MTKAYITYHGEDIEVTVESYFMGGNGMMANVVAVKGYPFLSQDVSAQGDTFGAWNCNGYRVRTDFIHLDTNPADAAQDIEREIDKQLGNPLFARREAILSTFREEPLTADEAHALINELAEIETRSQEVIDPTGKDWFDFDNVKEIKL